MKKILLSFIFLFVFSSFAFAYLDYDTFTRANSAGAGVSEGIGSAYTNYGAVNGSILDNRLRVVSVSATGGVNYFYTSNQSSITYAFKANSTVTDYWIFRVGNSVEDDTCYFRFDQGSIKYKSGSTLNTSGINIPTGEMTVYTLSADSVRSRCNYTITFLNGSSLSILDVGSGSTNRFERFAFLWNQAIGGTSINAFMEDWYICNETNPNCYPTGLVYVSPTPSNADHNNVQAVINISAPITSNITLYFDQNNPPTTKVADMRGVDYLNWTTTAVATGTYYYQAITNTTGISNSTVQSWVYDTGSLGIQLNANNFFTNNSNISRLQVNKNLTFNLTDDIGLYGYELNISNSTGQTMVYILNTTLSGTLVTYINYTNFTNWALGNYSVYIGVADSHTLNSIGDYATKPKANGVEFTTTEGNKITISSVLTSTVTTSKKTDRYSFNFDMGLAISPTKVFKITSANRITYIQNSKYKGHFVITNNRLSGNWIDFESDKGIPSIRKISDYEYEITFNTADNVFTFNSIGGLNQYNVTYKFQLKSLTPYNLNAYLGNCPLYSGSNEFDRVNMSPSPTCINNILASGCTCSGCQIVGSNCRLALNVSNDVSSRLLTRMINNTYSYGIDNCSNSFGIPSNATTLNILFKDISNTFVTVNYSSTLNYLSNTYVTSNNNINYTSFCIYPNWLNISTNLNFLYQYTGIPFTYSLLNYYLNNNTINLTLIIDTGGTTEVLATVYDNTNQVVEGAYISVLKYNSETGNYDLVGTYSSNFEGQSKLYLTLNNVYYKFQIFYPQTILKKITNPTYIYQTTINFQIDISPEVLDKYFKSQSVYSVLTFNNATNTLRYDYADTALTISQACLYVYDNNQTDNLFNSTCSSSTSGTLLLGLTPINGTTYIARTSIFYGIDEITMNVLSIFFPDTDNFAMLGLIIDIILTIAFAFILTFSIPLAVIMIPLPTVFLACIHLMPIDPALAIGVEIAALVVAIFINSRG